MSAPIASDSGSPRGAGADGDRRPLIVHVVYRFAVGGLENGVVNLVNRMPADAWRHAIVSLTDVDERFAGRITRSDVEIVALHKGPGHALPLYPAMHRLFRRMAPAIVHTRNIAALEATVPAWMARVPVRVHGEHGRDAVDPDLSSARRRLVRRLYRPFVTRYVALAPDLARHLVDAIGVPERSVEQIFNGVDTRRFEPAEGRPRIEGCPFGPDHWLVGTVGRLETVKDQGNLAAAFVEAVRRDPEARRRMRLVVVGEGKLRGDVLAILDAAGLRPLAWLPGERADVPAILQGLDCFALPSRAEGVSNTILEAMACGRPVVATAVGANADLVVHGDSGTIVPPSDAGALADALLRYLHAPALAAAHGAAARRRVEQRFSLERMIERYHLMYRRLVDPRALRIEGERTGPASGSFGP